MPAYIYTLFLAAFDLTFQILYTLPNNLLNMPARMLFIFLLWLFSSPATRRLITTPATMSVR